MTAEFDIKHDFGVYDHIPDLAYFDSASTTLVPRQAVSVTSNFLDSVVASARRGAHRLAVKGGAIVEDTRKSLATFLETDKSQISFQKSIPTAVASFVYGFDWKTNKKNKILIGQGEENSILVSLLQSAKILGLDAEIVPIDEKGNLLIDELEKLMDDNTGLVAVSHVSPGPGISNPIHTIAEIAHQSNALLLTDATRSAGLTTETLTALGSDILVLSANIGLMGPPGLAIQWIDKSIGETHKPGILGASSVTNVENGLFETALQPDKFESGHLNVPAIAGLDASLEYLTKLRSQGLTKHINKLSKYLVQRLTEIDSLILYGEPDENNTIFGFNLNPDDGINCHDVSLFLDESSIAVRSGILCAHPLIQSISNDGMIQASIHAYNSLEDIDRLADTINIIATELL
ncbi:MAG: aminotransferase class V-fold PLP-dependent enzyme [Candidatus Thorarchaeota archaeon]|jgi:cysteine desulfurase/selenocysteine lyase